MDFASNYSIDEPLISAADEDRRGDYPLGVVSKQEREQEMVLEEDSSVLLQNYYETIQNGEKQWVFSEKDVHLNHDRILGRGNFGEVLEAKWNGGPIACKRLHESKKVTGNNSVLMQKLSVVGNEGDYIGKNILTMKQQKEQLEQNKAMLRELQFLTKLRHPNLVLFLGICCDDSDVNNRHQPTMILTELMSCSLYDVLEIKKIALDLPDVLDIVTDVAQGLSFLHGFNPTVMHLNLNSRNILLKGREAKIADFGVSGQGFSSLFKPLVGTNSAGKTVVSAAVIEPTPNPNPNWEQKDGKDGQDNSRNSLFSLSKEITAFLAPEIVKGSKYEITEKADMFSLAVIILHMVIGECPTVDNRENNLETLNEKQPCLKDLVLKLLDEAPIDRFSATIVVEELDKIKFNDRHYPLDRRRPSPQSEVGIVARQWMTSEMANENKLSILRLSQMRALLEAEGGRWKKEGGLVAEIQEQLEEANRITLETTEKYSIQSEKLKKIEEKERKVSSDLRTFILHSDKQTRALEADKQSLGTRVLDLDMRLRRCVEDLTSTSDALEDVSERLALRDNGIIDLKQQQKNDKIERESLNQEIDALNEENNELETRLEQALTRWKAETESSKRDRTDFIKLRTTCANLLKKSEILEEDKKRLNALVKEQEKQVLPEDILRKIDEQENDIAASARANEALMEQKQDLDLQLSDMTDMQESTAAELEKTQDTLKEKKNGILKLEAKIQEIEEEAKDLDAKNQEAMDNLNEKNVVAEMKITKLEAWVKSLEKGVIPEGHTVTAPETSTESSLHNNISPSALLGSGGEGGDDGDSLATDDDSLSLMSEGMAAPKKFHFGDVAVASKMTTERINFLKTQNKDKKEKERKAAIRAADSMAKARVKAYEGKEDGTGESCVGMIKMLKESVLDEHICWRSCRALRTMILNESMSERLREVSAYGELDLICLEILQTHTEVDSLTSLVQGQAVQLLGVVTFGSDLVRRRAGENGAMKWISIAIEKYGGADEKVLQHCLTSVTNLAHNSQDNRHRFIDCGGLDSLTDAMERHLNSSKVQRQGCWAMLTLAGSDETARLVAQAGGSRTLMTLINALLRHPGDSGVQQFGLWAISNMALAGSDITRRLKKAGAPEICRIAIETHARDAEVIRQARHAIGVLGNANAQANSPKKKK